jgi:hypothetical protein
MTPFGLMLAAGLLLGQPPVSSRVTVPPTDNRTTEMVEDVEVMRRILNRAVGLPNEPATLVGLQSTLNPMHNDFGAQNRGLWGGNTSLYPLNQPSNLNQTTNYYGNQASLSYKLADPFDGVYLRGHGIVYTLKIKSGDQYEVAELRRRAGLATTCSVCHAKEPVPAAKLEPQVPSQAQQTEWDRTRNDLRGLKEPAADKLQSTVDARDICKPGKLAVALIGALAKNGRHIRHLPPAESVTLVVTLDGLYGPARVATQPLDENYDFGNFLRSAGSGSGPAAQPNNAPPPAPQSAEWLAGFSADETKLVAVGDLHVKQGKSREAAETYRKALARFGNEVVKLSGPMSPSEVEGVKKNVADVRKKLAQTLLAAGDLDAAKRALDAAIATKVEVGQAGEKPAQTVPVPAKLVLTVKKSDLDQAERLSAADFRKLVIVETVGLPPADKPKK